MVSDAAFELLPEPVLEPGYRLACGIATDLRQSWEPTFNESGFATRLMATADGGHTWTVVAKR